MPRITKSLFRMPAEWERQQSTLIGWPYNKNDWPGKFKNIPKIFAEIISKITKSQEVNLLIKNFKALNVDCCLLFPPTTKFTFLSLRDLIRFESFLL